MMRYAVILFALMSFLGCRQAELPSPEPWAPAVFVDGGHGEGVDMLVADTLVVDTLVVDKKHSLLKWKGTKFFGLGKHEGTIDIRSGEVYIWEGTLTEGSSTAGSSTGATLIGGTLTGGALIGGTFDIDMRSIRITDIPQHEPVPRKRLRDHLMSDDFFAASSFPVARFVITKAVRMQDRTYAITGTLTLRGQAHPITFEAEIPTLTSQALEARAVFRIDRQRWGVSYVGSALKDDLVDDDIHLDLTLVAGR